MGFTIEGSSRSAPSRSEDTTNRHTAMKIARAMRDALDGRCRESLVTVRSDRGVLGSWRGSPDIGWHSVDPNTDE